MKVAHPLSAVFHRTPVPLLPQPSPQGTEESLIAHLPASSGEVVETGSVQQSGGLWRGSNNCLFLYMVACVYERQILLHFEAVTWLCCLGNTAEA